MNFFSIFKNKSKPVENEVPALTLEDNGNNNITETAKIGNVTNLSKIDFEVTEISYDEFISTPVLERRRKQSSPVLERRLNQRTA